MCESKVMKIGNLILLGLLGLWGTDCGFTQPSSSDTTRFYSLVSGSGLTDDCRCGRPAIFAPMTGSFSLRWVYQGPLFTRYQLENISFHASAAGREYQVAGSGKYQVGGEVAVTQDMFLDVDINNGSLITRALCVNADRSVQEPWPKIQISVDQTNGTITQIYRLTLIAVPALQFLSILPDYKNGDVRLNWESSGGMAQLERATTVTGPYSPLSPIATNLSFTDVGALTNRAQSFYRLRQY